MVKVMCGLQELLRASRGLLGQQKVLKWPELSTLQDTLDSTSQGSVRGKSSLRKEDFYLFLFTFIKGELKLKHVPAYLEQSRFFHSPVCSLLRNIFSHCQIQIYLNRTAVFCQYIHKVMECPQNLPIFFPTHTFRTDVSLNFHLLLSLKVTFYTEKSTTSGAFFCF